MALAQGTLLSPWSHACDLRAAGQTSGTKGPTKNLHPDSCKLSPSNRLKASFLSWSSASWLGKNGRHFSQSLVRVGRRKEARRTHVSGLNEGETFKWQEGSIVLPRFDQNFFPVDETGAVIDVPSPKGRKARTKKAAQKLDADGKLLVRKSRPIGKAKKAKAEVEAEPEEDDLGEDKGPRLLRTARQIADAAKEAVRKEEAKRKALKKKREKLAAEGKKEKNVEGDGELETEGGEEEKEQAEAETSLPTDETTDPPEFVEEARILELESLLEPTESEKRELQTLKRNRKGRVLSDLRAFALKQLSSKSSQKRAELLGLDEKFEKCWYVVNCTVPEANVAEEFREKLRLYAPDEDVDVRTPELPDVRILKNGEARHFSTFLMNNVIFIKARLTPEVKLAMTNTVGLYNIDGADGELVTGVAAGMQAERVIEQIEDAEREVEAKIVAAQAKLQAEKEEAEKRKAEAVAARKAQKEQGGSAASSTGGEEEAVQLHEGDENETPAVKGKYAPGTYVMVARGAFAGLQGEVTSCDRDKEELKVAIVILGQLTEVPVTFKDVRPSNPPPSLKTPAADLLNLGAPRSKVQEISSEESPATSDYRSLLDWGFDSPGENSDFFSDRFGGDPDELGTSGEGDETSRVPLRSGVGVSVKKGPFKGCTGHVVDILLDKGMITVQVPDEGEIRLLPRDAEPEGGGFWALPPDFQAVTAPVKHTELPKPKKQLLWLDEGEEEDPEPKRELGYDGRPKSPDWANFERKPRADDENDLRAERVEPTQGKKAWRKLSVKTPEGKDKRLMIKYLGTNADNTAEMFLLEDVKVVTGVWKRLKPVAEKGEKKGRRKEKDANLPAFMGAFGE